MLDGRKRWIGNAVWCDVIVVYARDTQDGQVKAFVVEKGNPGCAASKITGKVALRMVQNADITLTGCRVCDDARLANCNSFADVAKVLKSTVKARHVCRMARDILGGNGILLDFHVMRHMCDMEALVTYEGTADPDAHRRPRHHRAERLHLIRSASSEAAGRPG